MRLWSALESLPTRAAVEAEWRYRIGVEFDSIKSYFSQKDKLAESFPNFDTGYPYSVIRHPDQTMVGVCPETKHTIPLSRAQLIIWECRLAVIATRLARAWNLTPRSRADVQADPFYPIGRRLKDAIPACILFVAHETADVESAVHRLIAEREKPFILCVPTDRFISRSCRSLASHHQCAVVSLQENLSLDASGELVASRSLDQLLDGTAIKVANRTPTNEFRKNRDSWTITFDGQTHTQKDLVGMNYIAILLRNKSRYFHSSRLVAIVNGREEERAGPADFLTDEQERDESERLQGEMQEKLKGAIRKNDRCEQERLQSDLERLESIMRSNKAIGTRIRQFSSPTSKHRTSVKANISRAIENLENKTLITHLKKSIKTGTFVNYSPNPDVDWVA